MKEFGFYPERLQINTGPVCVRALPEFAAIMDSVLAYDEVEDDRMHAPLQQIRDFIGGEVQTGPFSGIEQTTIREARARIGYW